MIPVPGGPCVLPGRCTCIPPVVSIIHADLTVAENGDRSSFRVRSIVVVRAGSRMGSNGHVLELSLKNDSSPAIAIFHVGPTDPGSRDVW